MGHYGGDPCGITESQGVTGVGGALFGLGSPKGEGGSLCPRPPLTTAHAGVSRQPPSQVDVGASHGCQPPPADAVPAAAPGAVSQDGGQRLRRQQWGQLQCWHLWGGGRGSKGGRENPPPPPKNPKSPYGLLCEPKFQVSGPPNPRPRNTIPPPLPRKSPKYKLGTPPILTQRPPPPPNLPKDPRSPT